MSEADGSPNTSTIRQLKAAKVEHVQKLAELVRPTPTQPVLAQPCPGSGDSSVPGAPSHDALRAADHFPAVRERPTAQQKEDTSSARRVALAVVEAGIKQAFDEALQARLGSLSAEQAAFAHTFVGLSQSALHDACTRVLLILR